MSKPILCLDFDGVLHSYTSGWKGAAIIPDAPTKGAIEFLARAIKEFDVQIFSSRSHQPGGKEAMRAWLQTHVTRHYDCEFHHGAPQDFARAMALLDAVSFPDVKPAAMVTLDDRAICFDGLWPRISDLLNFKPWNKRLFGTTGCFPDGEIHDSDEGELRFGVARDPVTGLIHVEFGKPVAWFQLPPSDAVAFARLLLRHADSTKEGE